ncbi:MAG: polysaccharide deacetylase family protein [Desulfobacterales bacterium]|nr:polysaccharide deacetylase family protein [Desulfobacterales bacterium]
MYHSIEKDRASIKTKWAVSHDSFKRQIQFLKNEGWHSFKVEDLFSHPHFPVKSVIITFDDGFNNNFDFGFRVLLDYGITATWFIVTNDIGKQSSWPENDIAARDMLAASQIVEMTEGNMEIGSHTRSHPKLPELNSEKINEEICKSKEDLENIISRPVYSFAYPFGRLNDDCVKAVKKAGYKIACTTKPGWAGSDTNRFLVRRVAIFGHDNLSTFARKLAFADTEVGWVKILLYIKKQLWMKRLASA